MSLGLLHIYSMQDARVESLRTFEQHCSEFRQLPSSADGWRRLPTGIWPGMRTLWDRGIAAIYEFPELAGSIENGTSSKEAVSKLWWRLFRYFVDHCLTRAGAVPAPLPPKPLLIVGETQVSRIESNADFRSCSRL